jgi:hypothetical protein
MPFYSKKKTDCILYNKSIRRNIPRRPPRKASAGFENICGKMKEKFRKGLTNEYLCGIIRDVNFYFGGNKP